MKHTLLVEWQSHWSTENVQPTDKEQAFIVENITRVLCDVLDADAKQIHMVLDGETLARSEHTTRKKA